MGGVASFEMTEKASNNGMLTENGEGEEEAHPTSLQHGDENCVLFLRFFVWYILSWGWLVISIVFNAYALGMEGGGRKCERSSMGEGKGEGEG